MSTTIITPDADVALDLINRCIPVFAAGMAKADPLTLQHEAERLDSVPSSPVVRTMRAIVEAELAARGGAR